MNLAAVVLVVFFVALFVVFLVFLVFFLLVFLEPFLLVFLADFLVVFLVVILRLVSLLPSNSNAASAPTGQYRPPVRVGSLLRRA